MTEQDDNRVNQQDRQTRLVQFDLPGLRGPSYVDESMVPKLERFIAYAREHGVEPNFNSAYRTQEQQDALQGNPNAITPASKSLHSTGFAVDMNFSSLPKADQQVLLDAAEHAGLKWGGLFKKKDPPHFYSDLPEGVTRDQAIKDAREDYDNLTRARPRAALPSEAIGEGGLQAALARLDIPSVAPGDEGQQSRAKLADQLQAQALEGSFRIGPDTRIELSQSGNSLRLVNGDGSQNVTIRDVTETLATDQATIAANLSAARTAAQAQPEVQRNPVLG